MYKYFDHIESKKYDNGINPETDKTYIHDARRAFVIHYRDNIADFYTMLERKYEKGRDIEALKKIRFNNQQYHTRVKLKKPE